MSDPKDLDFMSELDAVQRMRAGFSSNMLLFFIALLLVLFVFWASFFEIEEITRGGGQVVPSSQIQVVQSLEGGILAELFVKEGDIVAKNQSLARIQNVAFSSEERGIKARFASFEMKAARLQAETEGALYQLTEEQRQKYPKISKSEKDLYTSRQKELQNAASMINDKVDQANASLREIKAQIGRWNKNIHLMQKELRITRDLAVQNAVPKLDVIRLEREMNTLKGNIEAAREKKSALSAELSATKKEKEDQLDKFRSAALSELNEVQTNMAALEENLVSAEDRVDRTELKSPLAGIVKSINVKTIGGVVEPAMRLIEIVPIDDDLEVTAKVNPADIAFLKVGQDVNVKVTAYDPQRFGSLKGKLKRISADSVTDREGNVFFEIYVVTDKNYLGTDENPLPIIPGMQADIEVITGKRSIMTYLLKPVLRARDRALTER